MRQRRIRGNRTATPDLCRGDDWIPSKASSNTCSAFTERTGPNFSTVLRRIQAEEFRAFAAPGFAKTVYALSVRALGPDRTLLAGVMRTATTSEDAQRWFRRYWTFGVGSGAHLLVHGLLDVTREIAEQRNPRFPLEEAG